MDGSERHSQGEGDRRLGDTEATVIGIVGIVVFFGLVGLFFLGFLG